VNVSTVSYTGTLTITEKAGTLVTRSIGVAELIPNGIGVQFDHVIAGTGKFRGATGVLYFDYTVSADGTSFTNAVSGKLCLSQRTDDDDD
jgi:hypothetical protein